MKHTPEFTQPQLPFDETGPNPSGLCMCGCGQKTSIVKESSKCKEHLKGKPVRFIVGHSRRKRPQIVAPKLCECGCGQYTNIAKSTSPAKGAVRGQRQRFVFGHNNRLRPARPPADRFWEKVDVRGPDECWEWQAGKAPFGYGVFVIGSRKDKSRRRIAAHRFSYELHVGPIPAGMEVCHKCDNPPCVNPAHLFLGSHQENVDDMVNKQRHTIGTRNHQAKLTEDDIPHIRKLGAQGVKHEEIAAQYGVVRSAISLIIEGKRWQHIK